MEDERGIPGGRPSADADATLVRALRWTDAFWIASGVPALLVFSIGFVALLVGPVSGLVWILSVLIGLGLAFTYAELAGMFPEKSGGPPVFGAQAWKRYFPAIAPLNIWAYWFGWSAVQATGVLLMGQYIQRRWAPGQTWSLDWSPTTELGIHVNFAYVVGAAILVGLFWLNRFGIRQSAWTQRVLAVTSLIPLALLFVVPIFQGKLDLALLDPFGVPGHAWWSWATFKLVCAGLFIAGWSAYGFETAVAYTAEFRNPQRDAPRAIFAAGGLCLFFYGVGPFVLYSVVGGEQIREDPSTALVPLANSVFGPAGGLLIGLLLVALLLSVNTAVLGCARTLYQASKDGWTFRFLQGVSRHGVPAHAMAFAVGFNLILMLLGNVNSIIAAAAIGYVTFHTLNPVTGYLLRKDAAGAERPYRAPAAMIRLGVALAAVNLVLVFVGAPSWGWSSVALGWLIVLAGIPIYYYRRWRDGLLPARRSAEIDPLGADGRWAHFEPMLAYVVATGGVLTVAAWRGWGWAYVIGLLLAAGWALGFLVSRNRRARWFGW